MVSGARAREGASRLGCLVTLLVLSIATLLGLDYAQLYYRNHQYEAAMRQAVYFARRNDDARIVRRLRAKADSLDMPAEAKQLTVTRRPSERHIEISAEYVDTIRGPVIRRAVRFRPRAEGSF